MTINEAITIYTEAQKTAAEARKAADAAKKIIMVHIGDADELTTDQWSVYVKRTPSTRLDTDSLYKDFPDIKETYGKTSVSVSLTAHARTGADAKTA